MAKKKFRSKKPGPKPKPAAEPADGAEAASTDEASSSTAEREPASPADAAPATTAEPASAAEATTASTNKPASAAGSMPAATAEPASAAEATTASTTKPATAAGSTPAEPASAAEATTTAAATAAGSTPGATAEPASAAEATTASTTKPASAAGSTPAATAEPASSAEATTTAAAAAAGSTTAATAATADAAVATPSPPAKTAATAKTAPKTASSKKSEPPTAKARSKKSAPGTKPAGAKTQPGKGVAVVPLPAQAPVFWFGYDVAWAKLVVARVVLFGLLAADAILQIRHAPRYGAGGFNVAQLPGLDALAPSRPMYEIAQLVSAYLFVLAALGVATRVIVPCATAIYAWLYFTSQLDGYQHHYLVALILGIACFVPWQRPENAEPSTPVRTWAIRLILIQLGILYLWAAISKMDHAWLDGRTLAGQITGPLRSLVDSSVGIKVAARFTIFVELALAITVWIRPAWFLALPIGVVFHTSILLSGLEIGLFAWLMLGLYVLVVPDRAWVWLAERAPFAALRRSVAKITFEGGVATGVAVVGGGAAAVVVAALCRFQYALTVALALALVPVAIVVARRIRGLRGGGFAGVAHVAAILVWVALDRTTDVAADYFRFWGGSSRRLGDLESSERAYRQLVEMSPDDGYGHYQLGRVLLRRDDETGGLAELRLAQVAETARARSYVAEAQYLASKGRTAEAIEKAREATYAEPESKEANELLDNLTGAKKPATPAAPTADDDTEHP